MKVLSLFSGIGGFEIACEWAGMEVVGQVEIDPFCQKVLAKHWPHVKRMSDIKQVRGDEFGTINIIVGGVPCQPASVAGKRRGTEDDRWLWPEAIRIVRAVRPRWCVFENPAGILSLQGGGVPFNDILSEMEREGYEVGAYSIPACSVGAPHKRERVFIVGYSCKLGLPRKPRRRAGEEPTDGYLQLEKRVVADTSKQGLQRSEWSETFDKRERSSRPTAKCSSNTGPNGAVESGLGRVLNEFSAGMDGGVNHDNAEEARAGKVLQAMREKDGEEAIQRNAGEQSRFQPQEVLRSSMCGNGEKTQRTINRCASQEVCPFSGGCLRKMRYDREFRASSQRWQSCQQRSVEPDDFMQFMSHEMALGEWEEAAQRKICLRRLRQAWKGVRPVPQTLPEAKEIWKSLSYQEKIWIAFSFSGRTLWPAGPGEQYPWEPPRIAAGVKDRVARLKALGNAVVPQQVYPILKAIASIDGR